MATTFGRPGVYVTERLLPAPIPTTGTANAAGAVIGQFAQGPVAVTLVTSWYNFVQTFGGYNAAYPATFGVGQFFANGGTELYVRRVMASTSVVSATIAVTGTGSFSGTITAKNPGADGNLLRVAISSTGVSNYYNLVVYKEVAPTDSVQTPGLIVELWSNVRFDLPTSSDYAPTVLAQSAYISMTVTTGTGTPVSTLLALATGADGATPAIGDFNLALPDFVNVNRTLVLFAPGIFSYMTANAGDPVAIQGYLASAAVNNDWFAVLDTAPGLSVDAALTYVKTIGSNSNAAYYYPNVNISDPLGRNASSTRLVGPSGAVAGTYIAMDNQFGPFKAPAGLSTTISGAVSPEKSLTNDELDRLNSGQGSTPSGAPSPINAIRVVPGVGLAVMGARTLNQDNTANRYVSTRRSTLYIKRRLQEITQFAIFENNDQILWSRLTTAIGTFLNSYRNLGGLKGSTENQAFFVKIDTENNTPTTIAAGEVNISVGVALQYPAEFIVITLSQMTSN